MLSSNLLVALCETDAEEWKFCIRNQKGSLSRLLKGFTGEGGFRLSCGKLQEGAMYLLVDVPLNNLKPDVIYRSKHSYDNEDYDTFMFGYLMEDAPALASAA